MKRIYLFLISFLYVFLANAQIAVYNFGGDTQDTFETHPLTVFGSPEFISQGDSQFIQLEANEYLTLPIAVNDKIDIGQGFEYHIRFRVLDEEIPQAFLDNSESRPIEDMAQKVLISNKYRNKQSPGFDLYIENGLLHASYAGVTLNPITGYGREGLHNPLEIFGYDEWYDVRIRMVFDGENSYIENFVNGKYSKTIMDDEYVIDWEDFAQQVKERQLYVGSFPGDHFQTEDDRFTPKIQIDHLKLFSPREPGNPDLVTDALEGFTDHLQEIHTLSEQQQDELYRQFLHNWDDNYALHASTILEFLSASEASEGAIFSEPKKINTAMMSYAHRIQYILQQWMLDNLYNRYDMSDMEGVAFIDRKVFPGDVSPGAPRTENATFTIDGNYNNNPAFTLNDDNRVVRPTGYFVPAGELVTLTIPEEIRNKDVNIRIGAHQFNPEVSWTRFNRFPRIGVELQNVDTSQVLITNPMGGALYITLPNGSDFGELAFGISGAAKAPYFCTKPGFETSLEEYQQDLDNKFVPWVDWESKNFMTTIPAGMAMAVDNPNDVLNLWSQTFETFNIVAGRPKEKFRAEYIIIEKMNPVMGTYAPASYPMPYQVQDYPFGQFVETPNILPINVLNDQFYKESRADHHIILHEFGHVHNMPTLYEEIETNVNLPTVAVYNLVFGAPIDTALAYSNQQRLNFEEAALDWILTPQFRLGERIDIDLVNYDNYLDGRQLAYQVRGYAKYADIAYIYGWDSLGLVNEYFYELAQEDQDFNYYDIGDDDYIRAASEKLQVNMAPLFEFWGILPSEELVEKLSELPHDRRILNRIEHYRSFIPRNHEEFISVYNNITATIEEFPHKVRYDNMLTTYDERVADSVLRQVDRILCKYYYSGEGPCFRPFTTTWQFNKSDTLIIPLNSSFIYEFQYVWEDVNGNIISRGNHTSEDGNFVNAFSNPGIYYLKITGQFPYFIDYPKEKLMDVRLWGDIHWQSMERSFENWDGDGFSAVDAPDLGGVTSMSYTFADCQFNGKIDHWDVSHIEDMSGLFALNGAFNGDLGNWDVGNVTNMENMFGEATAFNGDISGWDVSNVTNMSDMFRDATSFNRDIGGWDVSHVTDMFRMFGYASSFNQDLGGWDISEVANMKAMLNRSGLSSQNYDRILMGWAAQETQSNVELGAENIVFCFGQEARDYLVNHGWTIIDGGIECNNHLFITTWQVGGDNTLIIPLDSAFTYDFQYTWTREGIAIDTGTHISTGGDFITFFTEPGIYNLEITGQYPHFKSTDNLLDIAQWGDIAWKSMEESFKNWGGDSFSALDAPDLSQVTNMSRMFFEATSFNADLSRWDVSNVTDMYAMFYRAGSFDGDLSSWDVSNVVFMGFMFGSATSFNQDLGNWDVGSVTTMRGMFSYASSFDSNISRWNMSSVTDLAGMFFNAGVFNNTLNSWDVSGATAMSSMFQGATSFNQDLGNWDISSVTAMSRMFDDSGLSSANYDQTLIGWAAGNVQENVSLDACGITFCEGEAARDILLSKGWQISDGGRLCSFITTWKIETNEFTLPLKDDAAFDDTYNFQYTLRELNEVGNITTTILEDEPYTTTTGEDLVIGNLSSGTYQLEIMGQFPHFRSTNALKDVKRWGDIAWQSMQGSFNGWPGTGFSATDMPDLGSVTDMSNMFNFANSFNGDVIGWDVSSVTNMGGMFWAAISFNQPLDNWNVRNVTNMNLMFRSANSFNQSLDGWEVSSVTNMGGMFRGAISFNQPLDSWDVSHVTVMSNVLGGMFEGATSFNQDLGNWDVSNVTAMNKMFNGSGLSSENYDRLLVGWAAGNVQENVALGAKGITFCQGEAARDILLNKGWQIDDGGRLCGPFIAKRNVPGSLLGKTDQVLEFEEKASWKIYPNPAEDIVHVTSQREISVQLTDLSGQLLTGEYQGIEVEVPIGEVRAGIYLLIVRDGQQVTTEKIIKTN